MTIFISRLIISSVSVTAIVFGASQALAGPQPGRTLEPVITVKFDDLNTSTAKGSQVLYARIRTAAHAVCTTGADWYPPVAWAQQDCFSATVDQVVATLNVPALTTLHVARTGRALAAPALQAQAR